MSDELKVQIPNGYSWINAGEVVCEFYEKVEGRWVRKVQIPDGYRWVKAGEVVSELYEQVEGCWVRSAKGTAQINWHYITPIEPPKPEFEDAGIGSCGGYLGFVNPNDDSWCKLYEAPSIIGPEWELAGFVWIDNEPSIQHYYLVHRPDPLEEPRVKYAKAVRFRRVQGGAKH